MENQPLSFRRKTYHIDHDLHQWTMISRENPYHGDGGTISYGVSRDGIVIWCEDNLAAQQLYEMLQIATGEGRP